MIPITGPSITQKEIDYVADAVQNGWYANATGYIRRFEEAFASYVSKKYALALPSCTSAIHLALLACGIKEGDDVLVPDITWTATAEPITYLGANPIFVDVSSDTWCVTRQSLERSLTSKTKAFFAVDLYGNMPNMDELISFAQDHNLYFIEDAAEALGSTYKGKQAGSFGDIGVFSFHGTKTLTTGEGGMLVTDDKDFYERASRLSDHGRSKTDRSFWFSEIGYKYKMSNVQAALGLAQLERLDELVGAKKRIYSWYKKYLNPILGQVSLNKEFDDIDNSFWMTSLVWDEKFVITKAELIQRLALYDVASRPFFSPLSAMPAYAQWSSASMKEKNPIAYKFLDSGINLPSGVLLTEEQVEKVSCALIEIFGSLQCHESSCYEVNHRNAGL